MRITAAALLFLSFLPPAAALDPRGPVFHPSRPSALSFTFFISKVPSVRLDAGPGYETGGRTFFPVVYSIYYPAKGVARFPDGGQASQAYAAAYIFEALPDGPPRLAAEVGRCGLFQDHHIPMISRDGKIVLKLPSLNPLHTVQGGKRLDSAYYYSFDPETEKVSPFKEKPEWPGEYPRSELTGHYHYFTPEAADIETLGLPSPIPYIIAGQSDALLRSIAINSQGNRLLRMTIFRRWLKDGREETAARALADMKARLKTLPAVKGQIVEADIAAAEALIAAAEEK